MAQHKNAKPKPKGWLMAVVDCIYKEGASSRDAAWRRHACAEVLACAPNCCSCSALTSAHSQHLRARWLPPACAGETLLRKLGRSDMIKKQSVPEIVFAYFHNK